MEVYLLIFVCVTVTFTFAVIAFLLLLRFQRKRFRQVFARDVELERDFNQKRADFLVQNPGKGREAGSRKNSLETEKKRVEATNELERKLKEKVMANELLKKELQNEWESYKIARKELSKEREKVVKQLEEVAGTSKEEAEKILFQNIEKQQTQKLNKLTKDKINETKAKLELQVNDILARAIESHASSFVDGRTTTKIELRDEETKGKIIGKEGRNIKSFEEVSGTDIIIDQNKPNVIEVSCFNPFRREIATRALRKLIQDGRIQPQRIRETIESEEKNLKRITQMIGQEVVDQLEIINIDPELVYCLGLLKFRTSYGQNVLKHSVEVAKFAGAMAAELNLNEEIAVRAGLLHDIGKAKDYELNKSHVKAGVELAQKFQEDEIVINAIHSHHDDVPKNNVYSVLVSAADTLSAARPGARDNIKEDYFKRMKTIEEVCSSIQGVKKSYAVKSGRVIRVIVNSLEVNDFEAGKIADEVQKRLKTELKIPGEAKVEVIREIRISRDV